MRGVLPSTHSIELPANNLARSMTKLRNEPGGRSNGDRGRKVIGSERFDMRGIQKPESAYKAHNPEMPFRGTSNDHRTGRLGLTSKSTSTSLNKASFRRESGPFFQLGEDSAMTTGEASGRFAPGTESQRKSSGKAMNLLSMQELRDLDLSPEKR